MNAIGTHEFEKRNMTVVDPECKLIERPLGAFTVETKNGKILYEYTFLSTLEEFDEVNMCSYALGNVAYGNVEGADVVDVEEKEFRIYATGPGGIPHDVWRAVASDVLWFSRHDMTTEQMDDLVNIYGPVKVHQINKTIKSAHEIEAEITASDIIAVVAPVNLQEQFLKLADGKPVISCRNKRVLVKNIDGGEDKVEFVFDGWYQIDEVKIITHDL